MAKKEEKRKKECKEGQGEGNNTSKLKSQISVLETLLVF
jgi:hypothetical protein